VNGIYALSDPSKYPKADPPIGPLMWKQEDSSDNFIIHHVGVWWMGSIKYETTDYYTIPGFNDSYIPPLEGWVPCSELDDDPWSIGVAPAPKVEFWQSETASSNAFQPYSFHFGREPYYDPSIFVIKEVEEHMQMYVQELLQKIAQTNGLDKMREGKSLIKGAGTNRWEIVRNLTTEYAPELAERWEEILRMSGEAMNAQRAAGGYPVQPSKVSF